MPSGSPNRIPASNGPLGLVADDDDVDPGPLHAVGVVAATGRIADAAGQRTLADDRKSIALRCHRTVEWTGREDQRVFGSERVDAGLGSIVEKSGAVALATDIESRDLFIERLE